MNVADRLRALAAEVNKGWLPRDEWGPKCEGCGTDEFRIDGYCSCECRDWHNKVTFAELARWAADAAVYIEAAEVFILAEDLLARLDVIVSDAP